MNQVNNGQQMMNLGFASHLNQANLQHRFNDQIQQMQHQQHPAGNLFYGHQSNPMPAAQQQNQQHIAAVPTQYNTGGSSDQLFNATNSLLFGQQHSFPPQYSGLMNPMMGGFQNNQQVPQQHIQQQPPLIQNPIQNPNQLPNQNSGHIPNHIPNQIPNQMPIQSLGQIPSQVQLPQHHQQQQQHQINLHAAQQQQIKLEQERQRKEHERQLQQQHAQQQYELQQQQEQARRIKEQQLAAKRAEEERLRKEVEDAKIAKEQELARQEELRIRKEKEEEEKTAAEIQKRRENASLNANEIQANIDRFPEPLHFAGTVILNKIENLFPFPSDTINVTEWSRLTEETNMNNRINRLPDDGSVHRISAILKDISKEIESVCLKNEDLDGDSELPADLPLLAQRLHEYNSTCFSIPMGQSSDDLIISNFLNEGEPVQTLGTMDTLEKFYERKHASHVATLSATPQILSKLEKPLSSNLVDSTMKESAAGPSHRLLEDNLRHFKIKRRKVEAAPVVERPPTPTEVIQMREKEWSELKKQKQEKLNRRHDSANEWNNDVMAEKESFNKFVAIVEHILESVEDMPMTKDEPDIEVVLIEKSELDELRIEVQKLKHWKQLHKVSAERLIKLMTVLEKNIRDVLRGEESELVMPLGEDRNTHESFARQLVHERISRAIDCCCVTMNILTSAKMPKQIYVDDTIEATVILVRQLLLNIIYPSYDLTMAKGSNTVATSSKKKGSLDTGVKRSRTGNSIDGHTKFLFVRCVELFGCFAELVAIHTVNETIAVKILYLGTGSMFVNNVGELQICSIRLLANICANYPTMRFSIMQELLNTLHRLPSGRHAKNCYKLNATESVSNFTILILQLMHAAIKMPPKKKQSVDDNELLSANNGIDDNIVEQSYDNAKKMAVFFLTGFLKKIATKGDEDYKKLFENFLQDILATLFKPEWPGAEMLLSLLGNHLGHFSRSKSNDMSLRIACLDYIGTIAAKLRKDKICTDDSNMFDNRGQLELIIKSIVFDESDDPTKSIDEIDVSALSSNEKQRKLMQALIDYLLAKHGTGDVTAEFAIQYYAGDWYKLLIEEYDIAREAHQKMKSEAVTSERDHRKAEKKFGKLTERVNYMKHFLILLSDRKSLRKRLNHASKNGMIMLESDAEWSVRYMASKRTFVQSFDKYLNFILYGIHLETTIGLRTKAMRCLTLIIEADNDVLMIPEVHSAVQARMMDLNAAVREATIDLVGKYLISHPEFLNKYFEVLMGRMKDSSLAVRKRVIRILKEIIEKDSTLIEIPAIFCAMIKRINDEEGVRKLVIEAFEGFWFIPISDSNGIQRRAQEMAKTMELCTKECIIPNVELLFNTVLKQVDKDFSETGGQIVDALVDIVLTIDQKIASDTTTNSTVLDEAAKQKANHSLLMGVLVSLSIFSAVKPELLVHHAEILLPYLSMNASTASELQVLKEVTNMLEKIVPLMDYPPETFLDALEERLKELVTDGGKVIIASSLACMSSAYKKWHKRKPLILTTFLQYLSFLLKVKEAIESNSSNINNFSKAAILRSLYTLGIMCKSYNFDEIMADEDKSRTLTKSLVEKIGAKMSLKDPNLFRETVYQILISFLKHPSGEIRLNALMSMGYFASEHSEYLTHTDTKNMYLVLLSSNDKEYLKLKTQALQNLSLFLSTEDLKMAKSAIQWQAGHEGEDLKEMELGCAGLSSSIIQLYWNSVLNSYFNSIEEVRTCASQVVFQTLQQGLVTPGSSIPTLIAMTTDPQVKIRYRIENVLKEIDSKYAGMLPSKTSLGIRMAYRLQNMLPRENKCPIVRGIRLCDQGTAQLIPDFNVPKNSDDGVAMLSGLYILLRSNRQQRRSFLSASLRLFSDNSKEKLSLEEWIFFADNLAMYPYQVLDEPLYVIHTADQIISLHGNEILSNIKQSLLQRDHFHHGPLDEDVEFTAENIYRRLPQDKTILYELIRQSQSCILLHFLKLFLMKIYSLNDVKVKEYSPSESAKVYEKPVVRKNVSTYHPLPCILEANPETMMKRQTMAGQMQLCNDIVAFRTMLLTMDKLDDEGEEYKSSPVENSDSQTQSDSFDQ
uniref:Nipped-B protein n=1 Tax=Rhabditophanes sp. KR3021 TaxID=114890 RepID=A0AC35U5H9_9BILA